MKLWRLDVHRTSRRAGKAARSICGVLASGSLTGVEFWYDMAGLFQGKTDVTLLGREVS